MDSELIFRGNSAEECEGFIRAMKRQGLADGKLRDDKYMADLASVPFAGPALRWYTRLDRNTRDSWDLLQLALLNNYIDGDNFSLTPSLSISESRVIPTPAAAVPTPSTQVAIAQQRPISFDIPGRLRIISETPSAGKYVSAKLEVGMGICLVCEDPSEALIVRSTPGQPSSPGHSRLRSFSVLNPAKQSFPGLGIIMGKHVSTFDAQRRFAQMALTSVDESKVQTSFGGSCLVKRVVWDCAYDDGEVRVVWETEDGAYLLVTAVNLENKRILIVNNFDAFCADNATKTYARVRLVFEPI